MSKLNQDTLRNDVDEKKEAKDEEIKLKKIINGRGEPAFGLKLIPEHLVFRYTHPLPGFATFTIVNTKPDRQAFKVKSSDNTVYTAKPSVGFIQVCLTALYRNRSTTLRDAEKKGISPGERVHIRVTYLNPGGAEKKPDFRKHVAVYHVSAGTSKTYEEAFARRTDGVFHYYCNHSDGMASEDNEAPPPEEQ
ncbi:hypothetical protein GCK72_000351 [Caenorhabditis remanei]|uniref:Major sperm protein n=1 Tax=Caenorhabditis remanei TaxID=31234 RepID=A0A6A5HLU9_CAERE|nr:hypothetical protein GCK72_000351 [Caenorhabditis remanei]KAF1768539.1 hypothetical protein GCK72_000351 [Caenorhabditis remanei]